MKYSLAFDLGATSIRGIRGYIENGILKTEEVLRFSHEITNNNDRSRWDWNKIINNIENTILKYGENLSSIGVDTWGVDFGILDKNGALLENPISYRDESHTIGFRAAQQTTSLHDIFMNTGNQIMSINTLFQILTLKEENKNYKNISTILMMPDLINYYLSGNKFSEVTIASTTQLFDLKNQKFSEYILKKYEIDNNIFPKIVSPGNIIGSTKNSKLKSIRKFDIPIISTASHDTASAVLLTKAYTDENTLFLSCGTWSLIGCLSKKPIITKESFDNSLTNETGYNCSNMFFKNITGLYVLEKLKAQLEKKYNRKITFEEINTHVENCCIQCTFDIENEKFQANDFDVISEINKLIGRQLPHEFDYFKVIYMSLVKKYKDTIKQISNILKKEFKFIHIIGGGAKSALLCQMIADELKMDVIAGPFEATAYGNLLVQKIALNEIKSLEEGFKIISKTAEIKIYKNRK